jgi:hypothetical protein
VLFATHGFLLTQCVCSNRPSSTWK